jgi:hypothetical protein
VASCAVAEVPWRGGIVKARWIGDVVGHGAEAFGVVHVAGVDYVDVVLEEQGFEGLAAEITEVAGVLGGAAVERSVTHCVELALEIQEKKAVLTSYDPGCFAPVDSLQIALHPVQLRIHHLPKRACVFGFRSIWLIGSLVSISEIRLCVEYDVVDHSVVERIPEVAGAV